MWQDYPVPYPDWDVRKIVDVWRNPQPDLISICAHRGASHDGETENTLTAFARAAQLGWESVEIDVRLTKDGKVVVFHDAGLGRLTNVEVPPGEEEFNPFTAKGYSPPLADYTWEEIKSLKIKDGYGRVSDERVILFEELLSFLQERGIQIIVQIDFKEPGAVDPALDIVLNFDAKGGLPAAEWCIAKPRADWYPTPAAWEALPSIKRAIDNGLPLPGVTPLYEVLEGHSLDNMRAWAKADYFVAYEIALQHEAHGFRESVDFLKSHESIRKGQGGWFIGSDLPRGYFEGKRTIWDDSSCRDAILREGPDMPCQLVEGVGARKPGHIEFGSSEPVVDQRTRLQYAVDVGNNYFIADTHTDVHAELEKMGKRNTIRMMRG